MTSELKRILCNELIDKGLVEENDVIRHSYTRNRLDNGVDNMSRTESREKLSPTLDTRCDCLGVVVNTYRSAVYICVHPCKGNTIFLSPQKAVLMKPYAPPAVVQE